MKIREGTDGLFIQDKEGVLNFLDEQGIFSSMLNQLYQQMTFGLVENAKFFISGEPYEVSHFLAKSEIIGYDIESVNNNLGLRNSDEIAFSVVLGDDLLCVNKKTQDVFLWKIQTGEGEKIDTGYSLDAFIENLILGGINDEEI